MDTTLRLRPERFAAGGEAIAHGPDGRIVFVRGGLPGDEVDAVVVSESDGWSRAVVERVVVGGPDRVDAPCPRRHEGCGGCDWQHLAPSAQLAAKVEVVRDALRRTGGLPDATVTAGASVPAFGYRTTLRLVGDADGRASFREDRSDVAVPASGCLVAHENLLPVIDAVRITPGAELTLRTSAATGEITALRRHRTDEVRGLPRSVRTGARAYLHEEVAGHRLRVSAASFFQSGPAAAELLVAAVRRSAPEIDAAERVLDAYAGMGLFAVAAVPPGTEVVLVETSTSSVADARANLAGRPSRIELGQFGRWRPRRGESIDVAIADPARSGLGKPGVAAMTAAEPPVVVLVSCDPVSMARDAALLERHGYRHDGTEVLDLFPQTHHVECVTRFVRG